MKKTDDIRLYINDEQVGACEKISISENIAELENLDYNDDFRLGGINIVIEDPATMKRYTLLGCTFLSSEDKFPREDYYSKLFRLKFKNKKIQGIKEDMQKYYWLSFCDIEKSEGQQLLGVIITKATNIADAIIRTWQRGVNPGGEIKYVQLPSDICEKIDTGNFDRLLSEEEAIRYKKLIEQK